MSDNAYIPPEVSSIMGLIDTFLRNRDIKSKGSRKYHKYHPSEWGKCLRRQQYKHFVQLGYVKVDEPLIDSQTSRLFDKGHNMHNRWQSHYFAEMGILRGLWECCNPMCMAFDNEGKNRYDELSDEQKLAMWAGKVRVHGKGEKLGCFRPEKCACGCTKFQYKELPVDCPEMNIYGHCDIILDFSKFDDSQFGTTRKTYNEKHFPRRPIVVDMKTIGDWAFKSQLMKKGAHKEYIIQLTIYAHVLDCEYGLLLYENKNDSTLVPYRVDRDEEKWQEILAQGKMMMALSEKKLLPPPRPSEKDEYECKKCEFAPLCHKSPIWSDPQLHMKRKKFYGNLL